MQDRTLFCVLPLGMALLRDIIWLFRRGGTHTGVIVVDIVVVDVAVVVDIAGVVIIIIVGRPKPPIGKSISTLSLYVMHFLCFIPFSVTIHPCAQQILCIIHLFCYLLILLRQNTLLLHSKLGYIS